MGYMDDERAKITKLREVAAALVLEGLAGWTVVAPDPEHEPQWWVELRGGDGRVLHLTNGRERSHRITIRGQYPRGPHGEYYGPRGAPEITVSADRKPADIAKEITRRLLPAYAVALAKCRDDIAKVTSYNGDREALTRNLAKAVGMEYKPRDERNPELHHYWHGAGSLSLRATNTDASLDFRYVPAALALELCAVAQRYYETHAETD